CALIEPSLAQGCIHANGQDILISDIGEIGQVEAERRVAAEIFADVMTIEHDYCMAKHTVKLNCDTLACVRCRNIKDTAIPADTGLRILAAKRLGPMMRKQRIVFKRKFYPPIMGQINTLPDAIIKPQTGNRQKVAGLGK